MRLSYWLSLLVVAAAGCMNATDGSVAIQAEILAVRHGDVDVSYETQAGAGRVTVMLLHESGPPDVREFPLSTASPVIRIGFLEPSTAYEVGLRVDMESGQTATTKLRFTTSASPYRWAPPAAAALRPGDPIGNGCTLGFLLRDAANETAYAFTAGHCVAGEGETLMAGATRIGTVLHRGDVAQEGGDWALVRLDPEARTNASSTVRHWTGPSRYAATAKLDDKVCLYGQGPPAGGRHLLHRCGYILESEPGAPVLRYKVDSFAGDSGAPVLAYDTGAPLAIHVSSNAFKEAVGTAVEPLLEALLERHGLELRVSPASYSPPPADPTE